MDFDRGGFLKSIALVDFDRGGFPKSTALVDLMFPVDFVPRGPRRCLGLPLATDMARNPLLAIFEKRICEEPFAFSADFAPLY